MFHFVSSPEVLTPELESSISSASAWVQVNPVGSIKPESNAGALVTELFSDLKTSLSELKRELNTETKRREENDMILAQHIANIKNLLAENGIIKQENERLHNANSVLYNCMICMEQHRTIRLDPCGHMATCASCTEKIVGTGGSLCPLCRTPITRAQRTFLS
jgi:hypothetical protein